MDEKKETNQLEELEEYVFKLMVDTHVDLFQAGFYFDLDIPPEEFLTTEHQKALLLVLETQERILRKVLELQGKTDPMDLLTMEMTANSMAELIVNPEERPPEHAEHWEAFVADYWAKRKGADKENLDFLDRLAGKDFGEN